MTAGKVELLPDHINALCSRYWIYYRMCRLHLSLVGPLSVMMAYRFNVCEVVCMDEIDAHGRQMLLERPRLTRGRLSVFRQPAGSDEWFPRLNVSLKRAGTDITLWQWTSHDDPVDFDEPPPYADEVMLEKYFELEMPLKSPRGLEAVFWLGPGATNHGAVESFSAALYLYPHSLDERGVQVAVIDFAGGLKSSSVPLFFRVNFPW